MKRNSTTAEVHYAIMEKTRVQSQNFKFFEIFEIVEHNFGETIDFKYDIIISIDFKFFNFFL